MDVERPDGRKLILVLGMHRSGTSALTQMLSLLGADPGKELLEAQEGINEQGFWEHRELVEINELLLSGLGRHWYDFRSLQAEWWKQTNLASMQDRARHFLETAFDSDELAVIKDPRLCILLPFWLHLVRHAGWQPVVVIATRAPWEVSASLCRRDPLDESTANLLWLRYFHDAETGSRGLPRCVVDYHDLLSEWTGQAAKISSELGIEWPVVRAEVDPLIDDAIDPSLRHQAADFKNTDKQVASLVASVYRQLQELPASTEQLDELWAEFNSVFSGCEVLADTLAAGNARLIEINTRLQALGYDHQQALDTIQHRDDQLAALNAKVEALGRVHHEALKMVEVRDRQLADVQKELRSLGEKHQHAQKIVRERDDQLQQANQQLQALGEEHAHALAILQERDVQLKQLNQRLEKLGDEHKYALGIVQERDAQLGKRNTEYDELGSEFQRLTSEFQQLTDKYQKLRNQPMVKGLVRLLSLEDK